MMVEGTHYNPNCNCKSCNIVNKNKKQIGKSMTNNITKTLNWKDELSRLEMCDQEDSGCAVCLGEWLNKDNIKILEQFIDIQIKKAYLDGLIDSKNKEIQVATLFNYSK